MATEVLTRHEPKITPPPRAPKAHDVSPLRRRHEMHVRRLKISAAAWIIGATLLTVLWAWRQWDANGAFESVGFDADPGQWNPTLWALVVGLWGLVVGIMALRVAFERPLLRAHDRRTEWVAWMEFHASAWMLGMLVLTPLWALIEWQDNGGLERWSDNSQPGSWDPWILYVAGIWVLSVAILAAARWVGVRRETSAAA